jgi:hypothetical protein
MTTALRPMTTGELLDRTFSIYRNNFVLFAGIAVLAPALQLILDVSRAGLGLNPRGLVNPADLSNYFLILLATLVVALVGSVLASAATVHAVSMVHLGKTTTIAESYKSISSYFGRLLGLVFLIGIIMTGIMMVAVVPIMIAVLAPGMRVPFGILGGLGVIASIVLIIHYYARLALSMASCVLEKVEAVAAIRRSNFLSKGATGRIWLIVILTGLIGGALSFAITVPVTAIAATTHMSLFTMTVLISCGQFLATTLATPISTVAMVLVYYDQRVRKEAFDLQLMMDSLGQSGPGQAVAATPIG